MTGVQTCALPISKALSNTQKIHNAISTKKFPVSSMKDMLDQAAADIASGELVVPYILERIDNKLE